MAEAMSHCRLYLISPSEFVLDEFENSLREALSGGDVACFQLRMKLATEAEIVEAAKRLLPICRAFDVQFLLNDYPSLVAEVGADGVHIGEEQDGTIEEARKLIGEECVLGVSCYASKDRAYEACEQGADYVAFGQFYLSITKPPKGRSTPDLLEIWSESMTVPSVAIGGITPDNLAPIVKGGADFVAVVSGVWQHPQGAKFAVAEYNRAISAA